MSKLLLKSYKKSIPPFKGSRSCSERVNESERILISSLKQFVATNRFMDGFSILRLGSESEIQISDLNSCLNDFGRSPFKHGDA